jgi:predicted adenine nucleotide alpha hydrolase (AANH) superfamily ATPase
MKKLLLHHCCAPCSFGVYDNLAKDFMVESFWFNPNIHPAGEHDKRKDSLEKYLKKFSKTLYIQENIAQEQWLKNIPLGVERCRYCYSLRLNKTAQQACELKIPCISTTLLASPYQKHDILKEIGFETAKNYGLEFVYRDFRQNYYTGKNAAREAGMYMQKYCGCVYSRGC